MKNCRIFFLIFLVRLNLSLLQQIESTKDLFESVHDNNTLLSHDISKHTLVKNLETTQQRIKDCLSRNGINNRSFLFCCGKNYKNVEQMFLGRYLQLRQILEDSFNKNIKHACEFEKDPCEKLEVDFSHAIQDKNANVYNRMLTSKVQMQDKPGVNNGILEMEFSRFKKNYEIFDKSRSLIAQSLIETVNYVQNDIRDAGLHLNADVGYLQYEPEKAFTLLGALEDEKNEHSSSAHSFHSSLSKQYPAQQLLNYYIANGMVNKNDIDLTKMPSEVLKTIKKQPEDRKE